MTVEGELHSLPTDVRDRLEASGARRAWDVSSPVYGVRALAIGQDGMFVMGPTAGADLFAPWLEIEDFSFPSRSQAELKLKDGEAQLMTLRRPRHRNEIVSAIPASELERRLRENPPNTSSAAADPGPTSTRPAVVATQSTSQSDPNGALWRILATGVGLQVLGGVIMGISWPTTPYAYLAGDTPYDGDAGGLILGWLLGSAGTLVLFVALIGFGTMLGIRASKTRS